MVQFGIDPDNQNVFNIPDWMFGQGSVNHYNKYLIGTAC